MQGKPRRRWRRLLWTLAVLGMLLVLGYAWLTRPARLRARTLQALRDAHLPLAEIGDVTFSPWKGLCIEQLVLASDVPRPQDPRLEPPPPRLLLGPTHITCALGPLLCGRLEPERIEIADATANIVCRPADSYDAAATASFEAGTRQFWHSLQTWQNRLPAIRLERGDVQLLVMNGGRTRVIERWPVYGAGSRTDGGYHFRLDRLPTGGEPLAEATWDAQRGALELEVEPLDLSTVRPLLTGRAAQEFNRLQLGGRIQLKRLVLQAGAPPTEVSETAAAADPLAALRTAEVRLLGLRGVIPFEEPPQAEAARRPGPPAPPPYLLFHDSDLTLQLGAAAAGAGRPLALHAAGQIAGAPYDFSATLAAEALAAALRDVSAGDTAQSGRPFTFEDIAQAELRIDGLELPSTERHAAFLRSPALPGAVRSAFHDYQPRGRVNVRLAVQPRAASGGAAFARVTGEIEALGAKCRYVHFPYDFADVRGCLRFADGHIHFDHVQARHGTACIVADGLLNDSQSWTAFDLVFQGVNVPLDRELYAALPHDQQHLWQAASPLGLCNLTATLHREEGSAETDIPPTAAHIDAELLAGSVALGPDLRLTRADGHFTIDSGTVQIHDLHGYDGAAAVQLSGRVWVENGTPTSELRIEVCDWPLDERATLMSGGAAPAPLRLVGQADLWGRISGSAEHGPRAQQLAVHITNGELQTLQPERRWTDCEGWAIVQDQRRDITSFTCRQGAARLELAGTAPAEASDTASRALRLHAQTPVIEDLFPQFVRGAWADWTRAVGLSGTGEIDVVLRPPGPDPKQAEQVADVAVRAARMQAEALPLVLRDVAAELIVGTESFELRAARARWNDTGVVEATGRGAWRGDTAEAELRVTAQGLRFGRELNAGLPRALAGVSEKLALQGDVDALLERVRIRGGPDPSWQFEGRLPLRNTSLQLGVPLTNLEGELTGQCTLDAAHEADLAAEFSIARGELAGRALQDWHGRIERQPGERWLRLEDLRGRLGEGEARGDVGIDPQSGEYELTLTLKDVPVQQLLPPPKETRGRERRGRVDGQVYLRGRGSDIGSRRGGGELRIRSASFLQTPVLASIFTAPSRGEKPTSENVDRAEVRFLWDGQTIHLTRVEIQSRDLRLIGEGTWDMADDSIRMTMYGANPKNWPRVAGLSEALELAGAELIQYRVEGTLDVPRVSTEALHRVTEPLRQLLRAGIE